jgi:hypothetical protein
MVLAARTVKIRSWGSVNLIPLWHEWNTLMQAWVVRHDPPTATIQPRRSGSMRAHG